MNIPEWFFEEPIEIKNLKIYKPKPLKQLARDNNKIDDKQLKKELAEKTINPNCFTDRDLKVGFKINLDSHHIIHANSKLTNSPNYPEFGIEVRYNNKFSKELSVIYARLINQYNFRYQLVFSARFDKQDEINHVMGETDIFNNLNFIQNLTETDLDIIDVRLPLKHQIQQQEMKNSGWRLD